MKKHPLIVTLFTSGLFIFASCSGHGVYLPVDHITDKTADRPRASNTEMIRVENIGDGQTAAPIPSVRPATVGTEPTGRNSGRTSDKKLRLTQPMKVKCRISSGHFKDVDNNKDGRISPVELAAVINDLTMHDFKKYDRNGDGYLDEAEYRMVKKR